MVNKKQPFTVGRWTARAGKESEFIAEWGKFAEWTARTQPGAGVGVLLQDPEKPRQFISFGPWDNLAVIKAWRERPEFKSFVVKANELCEEFQPQTLVLVASSAR